MAYPVLAPNDSWYKGSTTRSTITSVNIVDSYTPTGSETETWNADVNDNGDIKCYITGTTLTIAGNGSGKIAANEDSYKMFASSSGDYFSLLTAINNTDVLDFSSATTLSYAFQNCEKLISLDVSNWNVSSVNDMSVMFAKCSSLTTLDVSNWDVSNLEVVYHMFDTCSSLITLDLSKWNPKSISSFKSMFFRCSNLTEIGDISHFDLSKLKSCYLMFYECGKLKSVNLNNWDFSAMTDTLGFEYMFGACTSITHIGCANWKFPENASLSALFQNCSSLSSLDVSNWDVSNVTDMSFMFYSCSKLKEIDVSKWDTSKLQNIDHFAAHATLARKGMENWNTSSLINANAAFHNTREEELDLSNWDVSKVQFFDQMFENSPNLKRIKGLEKWNTSNGLGFDQMFERCHKLEEVDLSSFDTRKAKNNVQASTNGHKTMTLQNMFKECYNLKKVKVGANFSVNGDGTNTNENNKAILPTPSADYIEGADGYWYTMNGDKFGPTELKDKTAETYYASYNCASLTSLNIPVSVTNIETNAFRNCGKLTNCDIPDNVTSIGSMAFYNCINLEISELPESLTSLGDRAFGYCKKMLLSSLPIGLTHIKHNTFAGCYGIIDLTFHKNISQIDEKAFLYCYYVQTVTFEGTPASINATAFESCTALTAINVPWSEGEVANAPWGATNATINYNYTG